MNASDLARIESELDVELPGYYREFVLNYPPQLIATAKNGVFELSESPDHVLDRNRTVRRFQHYDWPEEYFVIGESGCGDYYAIDLDDEYSPVYLWNHEKGDFDDEEQVESLEEFAGKIFDSYRHVAKLMAERKGLFARLHYWWTNR